VVDAARCAGEIQRAMADRDLDLAEERRLRFRIGVNLGDVIADGGDIDGEGCAMCCKEACNRVRWNAQLTDAAADAHLWAERFERDKGDPFAVQNEMTSRIAYTLASSWSCGGRPARLQILSKLRSKSGS